MVIEERIRHAISEFAPAARLVRTWPLHGGMSATMSAFELEQPDGSRKTLIARQPAERHIRQCEDAAAREFRVLQALHAADLPVQRPVSLVGGAEPFYVAEYIEGSPELKPSDAAEFLRQYADQLAQIHRLDPSVHDLTFLPRQKAEYNTRRFSPKRDMREDEIYAALARFGPKSQSNQPVLMHGDFWPGNLLWRDGALVGVIDWEEALIGEPLADLAVCRLDLLWILGIEAMAEFTKLYQAEMALDLADLPYWDLRISLRLVAVLEECAAGYPALGRPDVTAASMRAGHAAFVEQALRALSGDR